MIFTRPARLPLWASIVVAVLDLFIIIATVVREAPLHTQLDREGYSATLIRQLVQGNWIRTVLWTVNAILLLVLTAQLISAANIPNLHHLFLLSHICRQLPDLLRF